MKYLPDISEINLHFLINVPYINKKLIALINTNTQSNILSFKFKTKEIELVKNETEFTCGISIKKNYKLSKYYEKKLGIITCNI